MARARNLKPSFFSNEDLAGIPPLGRILFAGLWCLADREGRMEDRPARIKAQVLPYDNASVDQLLDKLAAAGFLVRYAVDTKRYLYIKTFAKHQNPHKQEQPSVIPPFSEPLPNNIGTASEVLRPLTSSPLSVSLDPITSDLNPIARAAKKGAAIKALEPQAQPDEAKPYAIPLPEERPSDSLVLFYKVLQGAPYDDRAWDSNGRWGRWKQKTNELLKIFEGNYAAAYQCLKTKGEELTAAGRTWTLNTIVEQAHLWRQQHGGENHALINRERFLLDVIEQRRQRKIEGLRKISTAGEVLHEPGDPGHLPPPISEGRRHENGSGNIGNGRALAAIQSRSVEGEEDREIPVQGNGTGDSANGGDSEWGTGGDG